MLFEFRKVVSLFLSLSFQSEQSVCYSLQNCALYFSKYSHAHYWDA